MDARLSRYDVVDGIYSVQGLCDVPTWGNAAQRLAYGGPAETNPFICLIDAKLRSMMLHLVWDLKQMTSGDRYIQRNVPDEWLRANTIHSIWEFHSDSPSEIGVLDIHPRMHQEVVHTHSQLKEWVWALC